MPPEGEILTLHLLDTSQGLTIQTWTFQLKPEVRIGRAPDNDVVIPHPYVSRSHVLLQWRSDGWELSNLGSHGTLVKGERIENVRLTDGDEIRLGKLGPTLRFHCAPISQDSSGTLPGESIEHTIDINPVSKEAEVKAVTETLYFQQLQERVETLRARRR
jgi:predicted component of type VI protein secretion system